jgi:hypothetical protein
MAGPGVGPHRETHPRESSGLCGDSSGSSVTWLSSGAESCLSKEGSDPPMPFPQLSLSSEPLLL